MSSLSLCDILDNATDCFPCWQRTEVVDDASWVMGFLDIIDPALDSVKKLLNLDQPSRPTRQDDVKSTARSSAAGESSETSAAVGSDSSDLTSNDAGNNGTGAKQRGLQQVISIWMVSSKRG